ncbi:MAG TPA: ATP-dependent DNA helicase UvrD2 [Actinomycetes bacterium]|nr:ATP-dependent DNA helicase UvrD2 [Actinomycetes bacterium]
MTPDEVIAALDPEQRVVATTTAGPVCVLAGAGTGKTRAITHRIAYAALAGIHDPRHVLAVTFTSRAAGELRGRLRQLGVRTVAARTFHSAALRQLRYFWPQVVGGPPPRLLEAKAATVAEAAGRVRIRVDRAALRDLAAEIEWAKVTQTAPDDYVAAATKARRDPAGGLESAVVAQIYSAYEEVKRDRGLMDFEDTLLLTVGMLGERPDVADAVRSQYRHFVVDEYQDVSPLQQRLLELWLGDRDSLCVVGDANQTIYSFAGASAGYLLGFSNRYPDSTLVRLVRDYRSTPQVVRLANVLLEHAPPITARHRIELVAQRPPGPDPVTVEYPDETAEADGVARAIGRLLDSGARASEVAVLFRTNAVSETYEQALAEAGIPYVVRGAERFFERPEVREAMLLLRGAARSGTWSGGDGGDRGGGDLGGEVAAVLGAMGWSRQPPTGSGAARERWESLAALVRLAEELAGIHPGAHLPELVAELEERAAAQHVPTVDGVTLASLHAAKGLEWDAVFLVGLVDGLIPIMYAQTPDSIEEERRLLYVGITRAREQVRLSWAVARSPGGRANRSPSRFLDGLVPTGDRARRSGAGGATAGRRAGGAGSVAHCRSCGVPLRTAAERKTGRCTQCPASYDERLYESLRSWRLAQAGTQGVPAYVVFTDATLVAIAESVPANPAELGRISGIGPAKLDRYGSDVLEICARFESSGAGSR